MIKYIGYFLFIIGTIFSFSFAAKIPVDWICFLITCFVAGAGAVMIRLNHKSSKNVVKAKSEEQISAAYLINLIKSINNKLAELKKSYDPSKNQDMKKEIESLQCSIVEFLDHRNLIEAEYSFKKASEVFISFATGERFINRAWSALVDGYSDEVSKSLEKASSSFSSTVCLCDKLD
jgi:hypothetical protein